MDYLNTINAFLLEDIVRIKMNATQTTLIEAEVDAEREEADDLDLTALDGIIFEVDNLLTDDEFILLNTETDA